MSRDLRRYARGTQTGLLVGFMMILLVVGIGAIGLIWGREAAVMGLICTGLALAPLVLIWGILTVFGWIVRKANG